MPLRRLRLLWSIKYPIFDLYPDSISPSSFGCISFASEGWLSVITAGLPRPCFFRQVKPQCSSSLKVRVGRLTAAVKLLLRLLYGEIKADGAVCLYESVNL